MKRMHVMVKVHDFDGSLGFYRQLFGEAPSVVKSDYAKWMLEDPRVNFSIGRAQGSADAGIEHLGIQAETESELAELRERIAGLEGNGAAVHEEGETTCCYAESDKTWVTDGQGVAWEAFYTFGQAETAAASGSGGKSADCCGTDCCAT